MRVIALAALALGACSGGVSEDAAESEEAPVDTGGVAATIVSSGGPDSCAYTWDGQTITPDGILGRAVVVVGDAIQTNDGVNNMTEEDLPLIRFEADADAPFHCTSIAIGTIRATGFTGGTLRAAGTEQDVNILFEVAGFEGNPPRTVAAMDGAGAITVTGRPVALADLGREIVATPDMGQIVGAGTLFLLPSADTPFGQVLEAADTVFQSGGRATLASCYNPTFDRPFAADQTGTPLPEC
ncbi:hypothetical protein [Parasphingopyxis sp.]|uniref:hypothetical protein n=1 Tax=Parasphingopyxis sp. TaxID=1920299 RepID=UPI00260C6EB5|nr:hypothetical protein [Parasphingopyxis sp.]